MSNPKITAKTLLRANKKLGVSWREISKNGYVEGDVKVLPGLGHAMLYKFATRKGLWLPSDVEKLQKLGIFHERQEFQNTVNELSADELINMIMHTKKVLNDFIRAYNAKLHPRKARAS